MGAVLKTVVEMRCTAINRGFDSRSLYMKILCQVRGEEEGR